MKMNVELTALQAAKGGIGICKHELTAAVKSLNDKYVDAGRDWHDKQYVWLGKIVSDCEEALQEPLKELDKCQEYLETLIEIVKEYDSSNN